MYNPAVSGLHIGFAEAALNVFSSQGDRQGAGLLGRVEAPPRLRLCQRTGLPAVPPPVSRA